MRIGLYNRWLHILGGGERHMLDLALALVELGHQVEVLSPQLVDHALIKQRLGLEVGPLVLRSIAGDPGGGSASEASAGYDLFIAASHGDLFPSCARRSWMLVFFPEPDLGGRALVDAQPYFWSGGYAKEPDPAGQLFRWLAPEGTLCLPAAAGQQLTLLLERPVDGLVELALDGGASRRVRLRAGRPRQVRLSLPESEAAAGLLLRWRTEPLALEDARQLGLRLLGLGLQRRSWWRWARGSLQLPAEQPNPGLALASYHRLLANSEYTAHWVARRWGRSADLLPPAVLQHTPGVKRRSILSVGRFFTGLHAKRQEVLIEAFRLLCAGTVGWELHLAGGLDQDNAAHHAYLDQLRQAAGDLAVHFHINLPGEQLEQLYRAATLYWHAGGYGSDPERAPEAQEHFGISVVEAMSAGCVPLVYAAGGPAEVVRDGREGRHWRTPEQLVELSAELASDPLARDRLEIGARLRAAEYSPAAFAARVARLLNE